MGACLANPGRLSETVVLALYDYVTSIPGELGFKAGERVTVLSKDTGDDPWWEGRTDDGRRGQFPRAYIDEDNPLPAPAPAPAPVPVLAAAPAAAAGLAKAGTLRTPAPKAARPPLKPGTSCAGRAA